MDKGSVIERIKSGETSVLKDIYIAYRSEFLMWLTRTYPCTMEDAKDIYQVSVLDLYENVLDNKLTELKSSLKTYLFAIGKNKALNQNKQKNKIEYLDEHPEVNLTNDDVEKRRQEALHNDEVLDRLDSCLQRLGNPCKALLEDYYYYKKDFQTIRDTMTYKNTDTVKNLRYKCMKRLRKIFYESTITNL